MPFLKWEKSGEKFSALEVKAKFLIFITIVFLSFIAVLITYASYKGLNEHVFFDKDTRLLPSPPPAWLVI